MSELISGKEALIALANGEEVEFQEPVKDKWIWMSAKHLTIENILNHTSTYTVQNSPSCIEHRSYSIQFRLKPRTVNLNGIEVPARGENYKPNTYMYILNSLDPKEYSKIILDESDEIPPYWWETEEEIKQVVAALRSIFNE